MMGLLSTTGSNSIRLVAEPVTQQVVDATAGERGARDAIDLVFGVR
jgi:hypothetical protein